LAGTHLVPGPVVESVLTVPLLLADPQVRSAAQRDARTSVATVDGCADLSGGDPVRIVDGWLHGRARFVLGAADADALLVHALDGTAERLLVVPTSHDGVQVEARHSADPCQTVADVVLDCAVDDRHLVAAPAGLPVRLRAWRRLGAAAYLAGISERVLGLGVDHALQREQFGRPIGSFQALQHLLADVAVIARSLTNVVDLGAADLVAADENEAVVIGATAKARASREAVLACETVLQVLGGMGFTVEHPLHHCFKRALSLAAHDGSATELDLLTGRLVLARKAHR
jgi:alkylation response protein AidB-like acyl-CoA dehydrogenase